MMTDERLAELEQRNDAHRGLMQHDCDELIEEVRRLREYRGYLHDAIECASGHKGGNKTDSIMWLGSLKADAERYRLLRDMPDDCECSEAKSLLIFHADDHSIGLKQREELDAVIDAAMKD